MAKPCNASMSAILCSDNQFQLFLCLFIYDGANLKGCGGTGIRITTNTVDSCRLALYWLLQIESRKELNIDKQNDWYLLYKRFNQWKLK